MKVDTCWSAGHGYESRANDATDPGATSAWGIEAERVRKLTKRLAYDSASCKVRAKTQLLPFSLPTRT